MATTILKCLAGGQGITIGKDTNISDCIDTALPIYLKSTNLENNITASADVSGESQLEFNDINNDRIGMIQPRFYSDGTQALRMFTQRAMPNNSKAYNGIILGLDSSGNSIVNFMGDPFITTTNSSLGNKTKEAWHTALKPDVLFTGHSNAVPISLTASAANYTHMKIYYDTMAGGVNGTPIRNSVCIYKPDGKYVNLFIGEVGTDSDRSPWWKGWDIWIDGNTIKNRPTNRYYDTTSSTATARTTTKGLNMYIDRVEAW